MTRLDLTLPTLAENLALDEALLLDAEHGGRSVLRFWTWQSHAVIVGAGGKLSDELCLDQCEKSCVPFFRRSSGGGTVLLGPGCLLYSLVLPMDLDPDLRDLTASYRFIIGRIAAALSAEIGDVAWGGTSDLVWRDRKVSGNSQQRKRDWLLHHGTLLYDFDLASIDRYVKHPPRMPDYRRDRPHADFVTNLPLSAERLRTILATCWDVRDSTNDWPRERVAALVAEKYGQEEWHRRRP